MAVPMNPPMNFNPYTGEYRLQSETMHSCRCNHCGWATVASLDSEAVVQRMHNHIKDSHRKTADEYRNSLLRIRDALIESPIGGMDYTFGQLKNNIAQELIRLGIDPHRHS